MSIITDYFKSTVPLDSENPSPPSVQQMAVLSLPCSSRQKKITTNQDAVSESHDLEAWPPGENDRLMITMQV